MYSTNVTPQASGLPPVRLDVDTAKRDILGFKERIGKGNFSIRFPMLHRLLQSFGDLSGRVDIEVEMKTSETVSFRFKGRHEILQADLKYFSGADIVEVLKAKEIAIREAALVAAKKAKEAKEAKEQKRNLRASPAPLSEPAASVLVPTTAKKGILGILTHPANPGSYGTPNRRSWDGK